MVYDGVGRARVGDGCGWIRVARSNGESTLVYLTAATTADDVLRDLVLPSSINSIWVKYGGGDGRPLRGNEQPLAVQDEFLLRLGYDHPSRRARLGIDPDLHKHLITFYIGHRVGPNGGHAGMVDVLKGLVLPQWKRRFVAILSSTLVIYPPDGSACGVEEISLTGAEVEALAGSRGGRHVLRVAAEKPLFLGLHDSSLRDLWLSWLLQGRERSGDNSRLDLSGTGLAALPAGLPERQGLHSLDLSSNELEESSLSHLASLTELRSLSVSTNRLTALSDSLLSPLVALTTLDLSDNEIRQLPQAVASLPNLETLKVDRNMLTALPDGPYPSLKNLSAAGNRIYDLPLFLQSERNQDRENFVDDVYQPEHLTSVNLRSNRLKGTVVLAYYENLSQLDVSDNMIEYLDLTALSKLQNVQCSKNRLDRLALNGTSLLSLIAGHNYLRNVCINPPPIRLKHLDVSYNQMERLPEWASNCGHLRAFFASHNQLASIPGWLFQGELAALETLQLSANNLSALPSPDGPLILRQLFLQSNQLTSLPPSFFLATPRLKTLNLSKNKLETLPGMVDDSHQLEKIYLTSNFLSNITVLTRFPYLRIIHMAYNRVSQLPDNCVSCWPELEELVISGNRLTSVPSAAVRWPNLRILRLHSNILSSCPPFSSNCSLKVLDLSHNHLDKVDLGLLVPKQLVSLDLSGNSRLHVDPCHFQQYKMQRRLSLVDTSGQNRCCLPTLPILEEPPDGKKTPPWNLGFAETSGCKERLCVSQLREAKFSETEALLGLFDGGNDDELPQFLVDIMPQLLAQEQAIEETATEYIKYSLLAAHRELKDRGQRAGVCALLCHLLKDNKGQTKLRIACVGEARAVLRRSDGTITLAHVPSQPCRSQLGQMSQFPLVVPDPHVTEVTLKEDDELLIMGNKRLWEEVGAEEAAAEVRGLDPNLGAKRLIDIAQGYGCDDNLSVLIVRLGYPPNQISSQLTYAIHRIGEPNFWYEGSSQIADDRSSPSGQSDATSSVRTSSARTYDKITLDNQRDLAVGSRSSRKNSTADSLEDRLADCEESSEDSRSCSHMSEEQLRCWEYMLERNSQLLFNKELDTLSRGFARRSMPTGLWTRSKSNPHLSDTASPFLSQQFGSARSHRSWLSRLAARPIIGGKINAAYFGSLQKIPDAEMAPMRQKFQDSLETDRMHRYWDVATTDL